MFYLKYNFKNRIVDVLCSLAVKNKLWFLLEAYFITEMAVYKLKNALCLLKFEHKVRLSRLCFKHVLTLFYNRKKYLF